MSILVVGTSGALGEALLERLLAAGDDVRLIEDDEQAARRWSARGAHVARGEAADPDLVTRAARGTRTVVVLDDGATALNAAVAAAVEAAGQEAARLVVCASQFDDDTLALVTRSPAEHVLLRVGRPRGLLPARRRIDDEAIAEAVDAADDVPGPVRLELDLSHTSSWAALGLAAPRLTRGSGTRAP